MPVDATESPSPRPLRRDAERNRERLMQAARELFAERGLDVSMDEIAHHAGVGVGTAYRRFSSRDELIEALFDERLEAFVAITESVLGEPDAWAALVRFLEGTIAMQAKDRGLKELLLTSARGRERLDAARARMRPVVEELVRRGCQAGVLREGVTASDLVVVNVMLVSAADFTSDADPETWRRHLAIVLAGLRADAGATGPLPGQPLDRAQLDAAMAAWRPARRCNP